MPKPVGSPGGPIQDPTPPRESKPSLWTRFATMFGSVSLGSVDDGLDHVAKPQQGGKVNAIGARTLVKDPKDKVLDLLQNDNHLRELILGSKSQEAPIPQLQSYLRVKMALDNVAGQVYRDGNQIAQLTQEVNHKKENIEFDTDKAPEVLLKEWRLLVETPVELAFVERTLSESLQELDNIHSVRGGICIHLPESDNLDGSFLPQDGIITIPRGGEKPTELAIRAIHYKSGDMYIKNDDGSWVKQGTRDKMKQDQLPKTGIDSIHAVRLLDANNVCRALENTGVECYLNSALQLLLTNKELVAKILDEKQWGDIIKRANSTDNTKLKEHLEALKNFINVYRSDTGYDDPQLPKARDAVRAVYSTLGPSIGYHGFAPGLMNDAMELYNTIFIGSILDQKLTLARESVGGEKKEENVDCLILDVQRKKSEDPSQMENLEQNVQQAEQALESAKQAWESASKELDADLKDKIESRAGSQLDLEELNKKKDELDAREDISAGQFYPDPQMFSLASEKQRLPDTIQRREKEIARKDDAIANISGLEEPTLIKLKEAAYNFRRAKDEFRKAQSNLEELDLNQPELPETSLDAAISASLSSAKFTTPPPTLLLQFQRGKQDSTLSKQKLNLPPEGIVDLSSYIEGSDDQSKYQITGIICLQAESARMGHYISYRFINGQWFGFDDKKKVHKQYVEEATLVSAQEGKTQVEEEMITYLQLERISP